MKLPLLAAAALLVSMGAASAQWGPPRGYPPPPPPPGYGYYRPGPPPGYYAPPRYRARMVRRCWVRDTPWGPRRTCRMVPARRW